MATRVCFMDIQPKGLHRLHPNNNNNCSGHLERGLSPISSTHSSPRYERNMGFFHQLSRRFGLKSSDDLVYAASDDDSYSSSADSCSLTTNTLPPLQMSLTASTTSSTAKDGGLLLHQGSSSEHLSCASSHTSSTIDINDELQIQHANSCNSATNVGERKLSRISRLHRRSTSSIFRLFEGISLATVRSLSCSGGDSPQLTKKRSSDSSSSCNGSQPKSVLKTSSALELRKRSTTRSGTKSRQQPPQRILRQPVSYI